MPGENYAEDKRAPTVLLFFTFDTRALTGVPLRDMVQ